jgi:hypothetical protein
MFVHRAKIQLKPFSFTSLSQKIQDLIMPLLRLQTGFCSGVTSIDTSWSTATEDTYWKTKQDAEAYELNGYLKVKKIISEVAVSDPETSIFEEHSK